MLNAIRRYLSDLRHRQELKAHNTNDPWCDFAWKPEVGSGYCGKCRGRD